MGICIVFALALTCLFASIFIFVTDDLCSGKQTTPGSVLLGSFIGILIGCAILVVGLLSILVLSTAAAPDPVYAYTTRIAEMERDNTEYRVITERQDQESERLEIPKSQMSIEISENDTWNLDVYEAWNPITFTTERKYVAYIPKGTILDASTEG